MIGREKRVLLRHYLEQGMNKAVIARDLGVSRRTVYHWIETGQLDRELDEERVGYGPRCLMPSKLWQAAGGGVQQPLYRTERL